LHDIVYFEIEKKPAVAIASTEFGDAAKTQAKALGMADARYLLVPHPIQDATGDQIREKADAIIDEVIAALSNKG
jgi:hypothetical protein